MGMCFIDSVVMGLNCDAYSFRVVGVVLRAPVITHTQVLTLVGFGLYGSTVSRGLMGVLGIHPGALGVHSGWDMVWCGLGLGLRLGKLFD